MSRRGWVSLGVVAVLVLAGAVVVGLVGSRQGCGSAVTSVSAARSDSPFLDEAGRKQQPDANRDRAVASLGAAPSPPFGPVLGAVGYDYQQWAQLSSYAQGIGVRTRDNPDFTMLDDHTLKPLWSVQVDTKRSTYDADDSTYLVATLPSTGSPDLVALDARTGRRTWCAVAGRPARRRQPPPRHPDARRRRRGGARSRHPRAPARRAARRPRRPGVGARGAGREGRLPGPGRRGAARRRRTPRLRARGPAGPARQREPDRGARPRHRAHGLADARAAGRRVPRGRDGQRARRRPAAHRRGGCRGAGGLRRDGRGRLVGAPRPPGPARRGAAERAGAGPAGQPDRGVRREHRPSALAARAAEHAAAAALRVPARQPSRCSTTTTLLVGTTTGLRELDLRTGSVHRDRAAAHRRHQHHVLALRRRGRLPDLVAVATNTSAVLMRRG